MIVNINEEYAEVDFDTLNGGGCFSFPLKDLKHAEKPKRSFNYGRKDFD
jgi:hypothetical protein